MLHVLEVFAKVFGVGPQANGWTYSLWSGIGGDLMIFGGAAALWRHMNCHRERCWRLGRHTAGQFKVCAKHHPEHDGRSVPQDVIDAAHRRSQ